MIAVEVSKVSDEYVFKKLQKRIASRVYCTRNDMRAFAIFGLREIVYFGMSLFLKRNC